MFGYDKASKWLIQHYGDAILKIGGVTNLASWKPLQAELVQSRRLPDGLVEVRREGEEKSSLYVLELATYPEERLYDQVTDDMTMVYLDRRVLPEVLVLVLHPKGRLRIKDQTEVVSRDGLSRWTLSWRTVELWSIPAEELLDTGELGVVPWVPLSYISGSPKPVLEECRARIDEQAPPEKRENLLAVIQFLGRLRYNTEDLSQIFGGVNAMLELPFLDDILEKRDAERTRKDILRVLRARLGPSVPREIATGLETIADNARLDELVELAALCPDLESFRAKLVES